MCTHDTHEIGLRDFLRIPTAVRRESDIKPLWIGVFYFVHRNLTTTSHSLRFARLVSKRGFALTNIAAIRRSMPNVDGRPPRATDSTKTAHAAPGGRFSVRFELVRISMRSDLFYLFFFFWNAVHDAFRATTVFRVLHIVNANVFWDVFCIFGRLSNF